MTRSWRLLLCAPARRADGAGVGTSEPPLGSGRQCAERTGMASMSLLIAAHQKVDTTVSSGLPGALRGARGAVMEELLSGPPLPEQLPVSMAFTLPGAWEEGQEERSTGEGLRAGPLRCPGLRSQMTTPTTTPPTEGPPSDHALPTARPACSLMHQPQSLAPDLHG
ncbi:unnamed protein product [Rangifer tarandus platyrhynchus]|uniref:Uncharacterized protein n=1 Tax=Rangifer tarandus platyrhynchus TaxID=3082113 RepID=A0AC59YSN6_RANTA